MECPEFLRGTAETIEARRIECDQSMAGPGMRPAIRRTCMEKQPFREAELPIHSEILERNDE
jgi:hypothetical protein